MDILAIPFHRFLNIKKDLGTIHACVQLSLAEATSGEFLLQQFHELKNELIPVVRKTEVKYYKPANGELFSTASFVAAGKELSRVLIGATDQA